ncbi:YcxB family protein [Lactococcus cremoris]|uniref:YcxB family protein n=1 Tax=Lactococcus lactis subsp. cremoris TaxID=1359 RepID=UPI0019648782|nr:YcxB family protein [Lactococcus cremoris]QRZ33115.1 YcxB family protein [Lactococcus cremoris]
MKNYEIQTLWDINSKNLYEICDEKYFFASIVVFVILEIYAIYSQSIVGLVFGIAAPLIFYWAYYWWLVRLYKSNKGVQGFQEFIIDEEYIYQKSNISEATFDKSYIHKIGYHKDIIIIYISKGQGFFLHRTWLENGTFEEFATFLKECYDKK